MSKLARFVVWVLFCGVIFEPAFGLEISNALSTRRTARRRSTRFIILHTTEYRKNETPPITRRIEESIIAGIRRGRGAPKANYVVKQDGEVLRITGRLSVANHAGVSMWDGLTGLSWHSVGIEIVGYGAKPESITPEQFTALRELIAQLRAVYNIPELQVLTHSQIAYATRRRFSCGWAPKRRGRKQDARWFATPEWRQRLGLGPGPAFDPDVRANRLAVCDEASERLFAFLYQPPQEVPFEEEMDAEDTNDEPTSDGFVELREGETAYQYAGDLAATERTIYFSPQTDGRYRVARGDQMNKDALGDLVAGTRMLVDYVDGGKVQAGLTAYGIAGQEWKSPSTFYLFPATHQILQGDQVNPRAILAGTWIFFKKD